MLIIQQIQGYPQGGVPGRSTAQETFTASRRCIDLPQQALPDL
jgi:hypothetical protein